MEEKERLMYVGNDLKFENHHSWALFVAWTVVLLPYFAIIELCFCSGVNCLLLFCFFPPLLHLFSFFPFLIQLFHLDLLILISSCLSRPLHPKAEPPKPPLSPWDPALTSPLTAHLNSFSLLPPPPPPDIRCGCVSLTSVHTCTNAQTHEGTPRLWLWTWQSVKLQPPQQCCEGTDVCPACLSLIPSSSHSPLSFHLLISTHFPPTSGALVSPVAFPFVFLFLHKSPSLSFILIYRMQLFIFSFLSW